MTAEPDLFTAPPVNHDPAKPIFEPPREVRLRDYQDAAHTAIMDGFEAGRKRQLVVAATGSGKTVLFSVVAKSHLPRRTLILTDQIDLVGQTVAKVREVTGIYADTEQASSQASLAAKVVVATVQTMRARLARFPRDHFGLVVADECDRAMAPQWQAVLSHFHDHARVLGVTATPKRTDKKSILAYFQHKAFEVGALELIGRGYLAPITVRTIPLTIHLEDIESRAGDYEAEALARQIEGMFGAVVDAIREHAGDRKILAFLPLRETSRKFVQTCLDRGLNARHIDGESPDREQIKQAFRDRRFQLLSNPILLGRGYDDPSIDCVINLRPTQSLSLYQQIVGRGTRLYCPHGCHGPCQHEDRKKDLLLLDFLYQFKGMGPIRPAHLIAETDERAKAISRISEQSQGALDLRDLAASAQAEIEASLVRAMLDAMKKVRGGKGEYFNAFHWAANLKIHDLIDYTPETEAESAPPQKGLVTKLRDAGFIPETVTCQGHAEKIWAVIKARREAQLASFKQIFWLRKFGIENAENMSREEAGRWLDKCFAANPRKNAPPPAQKVVDRASNPMQDSETEPANLPF